MTIGRSSQLIATNCRVPVAIPIAKATLNEDATICKVIYQISIVDRDLQTLVNPTTSLDDRRSQPNSN